MAKKAIITVHPAYPVDTISPRLFGAFLEPIGTMVNGSMYNPKHPTADDKGFRKDFIGALKASGLPAVRLPGGNFISGWDWKDSIGPMEKRKAHIDMAWYQYIPNDIGHDEYLQWSERVGFEPMYTINLGTGDINDAIKIVEYTNFEGGTYWSDLRREYGHADPYGVKIWYLGNEMDGVWQIASWERDPRGYGILARETSKVMKWTDPTIETVACVSSSPFMLHYPQWDLEVLQECYETVDYISLHHYHSAAPGDYAALLGGACYFEDYINTEIALCDFIQTKLRTPKQMMLSFDEFGSRMRPAGELIHGSDPHTYFSNYIHFNPERKYIRHDPDNMSIDSIRSRRMLQGDMVNALSSASTMLIFLRRADRVKIGCMTGGLGALAATDHDHVWKSAANYPFTDLLKYARGTSMRVSVDCDTFDVKGYALDNVTQYPTREGLPFIDTAAAYDKAGGELNLFVINRNWESDNTVDIDTSGFEGFKLLEHTQLFSEDMDARNTFEEPEKIIPSVNKNTVFSDGKITAELKKLSWNVFRLKK